MAELAARNAALCLGNVWAHGASQILCRPGFFAFCGSLTPSSFLEILTHFALLLLFCFILFLARNGIQTACFPSVNGAGVETNSKTWEVLFPGMGEGLGFGPSKWVRKHWFLTLPVSVDFLLGAKLLHVCVPAHSQVSSQDICRYVHNQLNKTKQGHKSGPRRLMSSLVKKTHYVTFDQHGQWTSPTTT